MGERFKNIDKLSNNELLKNYPNIPWKNVKGIRDILSHHYFDLDAEVIFAICKNTSQTSYLQGSSILHIAKIFYGKYYGILNFCKITDPEI